MKNSLKRVVSLAMVVLFTFGVFGIGGLFSVKALAVPSQAFLWPVPSSYSMSRAYSSSHKAIDIQKCANQNILASYDGTVYKLDSGTNSSSKTDSSYGTSMIIKHNINGSIYYTHYAHMVEGSIPQKFRTIGATVKQGEIIGKVGKTGNATGYHLHFCIADGTGVWNGRFNNTPTDSRHNITYSGGVSYRYELEHTHDYSVYLWYWKEHPHYNEYKCSYCESTEARKNETNYMASCEKCNHTHNYNSYSHYDTVHPHYSYYKCSCGEVKIDYSATNYNPSCVQCNPSAFCVNLGDDFYGVILNSACWKPISKEGSNNITLETEAGISKQKWRFQRQSDGAYVISSCYDGTVLEMTDGIRSNGTQMSAKDGFWGGYYQQWYLIPQGSGLIFLSKHYVDGQWVMDLSNGNTHNGNAVTIHQRNNSDAQIWSVYNRDEVQLQPAKLSVSVDSSEVAFTWPQAYGATSYSMKISTKEMWENETGPYMTVEDVQSGYSVELPAGTYYAYIDSEDYYGYIMSNVVTFEILEPTYELCYNANGGSGFGSASVFLTQSGATSYKITSNQPTRSGYSFLGWSKNSTATYASYKAGDTITLSENTMLFAVWQKNAVIAPPTYTESLSVEIRNPSIKSITYGDKIILHADLSKVLPNGYQIVWTASNGNFKYTVSDDGTTCTISPSSSGDTIFTATIYDADEKAVSTDEQIMTSKAGLFDKIIAFIKKIFGLTQTISQIFKPVL